MTENVEWCVALVEYACQTKHVRIAWTYNPPDEVWLDMRQLRTAARSRAWEEDRTSHDDVWFPDKFGPPMMKRAMKAGLIAGREFGRPYSGGRTDFRYTTLTLAEEWDAEQGLSDGERAERTAAAVRRMYARNMRERGDDVWGWPVSTDLAAVPQDGIDHAIEGGLLHRVKRNGALAAAGGYLVPVENWDVYKEAAGAYENRQARAKARHEELVDRLYAHAGGHRNSVNHLASDQIEALLALIERPADE